MKVLLTATVQSHICQFHRPLADLLHEHGCEVHVAARDNLSEKNGLSLDFADRVFDVPYARSPKSPDNLRAYRQLKAIIDSEHYDVIHCNTPMGGIVTRLAAQGSRKSGTQVYYTAHGFHFYKGASKKNWVVFYPIEKFFAAHYTDKLITIAQEDYELAVKRFRCRIERIHGVGVDVTRYHPVDAAEKRRLREEMGFAAEQKILLCIGELLPNKNQTMAIRVMREIVKIYPDALLLLAGNGPDKDILERAAEEYSVRDNVRFLGYCTHLQDYQHVADLLLACSRREGLAINVAEAIFSGIPVVATVNRGHRELISSDSVGNLVAIDDVDDMAAKALALLRNPLNREAISDNYARFSSVYGIQHVKHELAEIYGF